MKTPKEVGRIYRPFDWYGWLMCILGVCLMCKFGGVGWIFGTQKNWWMFAAMIFIFWEYVCRVSFGRIYKIVYYDSIIHNMYIIECKNRTFYVNAENQDELDSYMESNYPGLEYKVIDETHSESYIKTDSYC